MKRLLAATALGLLAALASPAAQGALAKDLITVDLVNEPASLDPQKQWNPDSYYVYRNIFDNLVTRSDDGEIVPQVASAWEQLSDTQVKFTIRDDITFHDGTKLTPEDVVFSVKRIIDPAFASPQLGQFNKITGAEVTGANAVTLTTEGPYPVLLAQLVKLSIVPEHVVTEMGDDAFNAAPVGSGPYAFEAWNRGVDVTLKRNDAYWGDKGAFAEARFRAVPDASTRVADLQAGAADLAVSLDSDLAMQLESAPGVTPLTALTERVGFVGMNTRVAPLDNPELRKAIVMGVDREGIVEGILAGEGAVVGQLLSPAHFGWADDIAPIPYDPEAAKEIVESLGDAAKTELSFDTSPVYDQRIVQAVQQMLTEIGLNVSINMMDMASYLKKAQGPEENRPMLSFGRWSCACQDADGIMYPLLQSGSNWSRYSDPEMDRLLEEGRSTLDRDARLKAYHAASELMKSDAALLPLYQAAVVYGASDKLEWTPTANESLFLNRMGWSE
ncbi:peptide ABC transporter [Paroceanicella profunda]|uniref:Peptide ABC transporter n=1 Tax=Paroceanicella profunda TaxID=2579971 RepID=A0A5B8FGK7_9RHOB|nr:ABC transporter substrate-binding protein [Paroceanicella profunda]QDL91351.1 peptide ABC transporter [Paroceanicella profunda]